MFRNTVVTQFRVVTLSAWFCILSAFIDSPCSIIVFHDCNFYVEQLRRRGSAAFAGKQGFITLRDLFRWGERYRLASQKEGMLYDWDQHIADEGYLVLAGRVRKQEERQVIQEVIKKHINRAVDPDKLFTCES
jgi:midasin (ATPase involved in ribosome maturation)